MAISKVRVSGAWQIKAIKPKVSGAMVAKPAKVRVSGAWQTLAANHTASNSPSSSTKSGTRPGTISDSITCNPVGGVGPFTYSWAWLSGGSGITLSNATSQTCSLSSTTTSGISDIARSGTLRCTCTDTGNSSYQTTSDTTVDWLFAGSGA